MERITPGMLRYLGNTSMAITILCLRGSMFVQSRFPDGGGYFVGKDSIPTESPIGYELKLFGRSLSKHRGPQATVVGRVTPLLLRH